MDYIAYSCASGTFSAAAVLRVEMPERLMPS